MNLSDATLLLGKIKSIYPRFYYGKTEDDILVDAESWAEILHDIPLKEALIFLRRYASTNKWPPSPTDLREELKNVTSNFLSEGEAWQIALKLTHINWKGAGVKVELNYLNADEIVIEAWRIIGMENIAMTPLENIGVTRSNFIRIYNSLKEREEKERSLPECLRLTELKKIYFPDSETKLIEDKNVILSEKEKHKLIQSAIIKANDELNRNNISADEKLSRLKQLKSNLISDIKSTD
jgi:hypothetical protein